MRWLQALSRRGREGPPSLARQGNKKQRKKLPGFKGFGRSASTTQLVSLGGIQSSSVADASTSAASDAMDDEEDWRIEPVPAVNSSSPTAASTITTTPDLSAPAKNNKSLVIAKAWYFTSHAALALFPFPAIYLSDRGLSSVQIGTIMALRPFISAVAGEENDWGRIEGRERAFPVSIRPSRRACLYRFASQPLLSLFPSPTPIIKTNKLITGNAWAILADATCSHRTVLLSTFVAAGIARGLVGLPALSSFWPLLAAVLASEAVAAPVIILADAATQQAASEAGSDYGKVRLFGALGLGAFSPLNGLIVTRLGSGAGFAAGAAAWLSASCLTAMLPVSGLSAAAAQGEKPAGRRASEAGGSSCCGGHLPLPLPSAQRSPEREGQQEEEEEMMSDVDEEEEEEEDEQEAERGERAIVPNPSSSFATPSPSPLVVEVEALAGGKAAAGAAAAAAATTTTATATTATATTTQQQQQTALPALPLPSRFGGAATTRARLSSYGGGGEGEAGGNDRAAVGVAFSEDGAAAAVAAAAAALDPLSFSSSPSSPPPPPPPRRSTNALVMISEAFDRRTGSGDGGERRTTNSSSSSSSTRPLSPAVGVGRGKKTIMSSSSSSTTIATTPALAAPPERRRRRRTSSSSSSSSSFSNADLAGSSSFDASTLPLHRKIAAVFGSPRAALFFATAWALGYGAGTIDSWLFVFLEEPPLRASRQLMSVTILATCAAEVPAFFFAGRLVERFGSRRVLSAVSAVLAARLAGYWALPSVTRNPWAVLPLETLNGVTFGCGWAAGTARAASLAPPGLAATAQAAFAAVYAGLGAGMGSLAGGVVRSRAGGGGGGGGGAGGARGVFAAAAGVVAVAWAATAVAEVFVRRGVASRKRRERRGAGGGGLGEAAAGTAGGGVMNGKKKRFQRWASAAAASVEGDQKEEEEEEKKKEKKIGAFTS